MISKFFKKKEEPKPSKSKFRINWTLHLVDLIVVIIGVTIAFAISNYAERQKEVKEKNIFLNAMLQEIEKDIDVYNSHQIPVNETHLRNLDSLKRIVLNPENYASDTIEHYFRMGIFRFNNWYISDATYTSITATGKIDLVEDYDLKMQIILLYDSRAGQSGFIIRQSLDQFEKMINYLEDHVIMDDPDSWPKVFSELKFQNVLYGMRSVTSSKLYEFRENVVALEELKASIEEELGIKNKE